MPDEPLANTNHSKEDCSFYSISIRAWIALVLVLTVCANHLAITCAVLFEAVKKGDFAKVGTYTTISEPLYSLVVLAVGFYFGQKTSGSNGGSK